MIEAPEPPNETARLETLRAFKILDTDPEEAFDRLAWLAAQIFEVPMAHVSLIDEHREWFKAKCGVDAKEGERRTALCAHTISAIQQATARRLPIRPPIHCVSTSVHGLAVGRPSVPRDRPSFCQPDGWARHPAFDVARGTC